jgi:hypothetical protein
MLHRQRAASRKSNDLSCVLRVSAGGRSMLLTSDIEAVSEKSLLARYGQRLAADAMTAPHHGSKTSSTIEFLTAVGARDVIFPVGYRNRFGHPKDEVVARHAASGAACTVAIATARCACCWRRGVWPCAMSVSKVGATGTAPRHNWWMTTADDSLPFAGLRPERILAAVESMGFACSGALQALNSYENRVWQIGIDEAPPLVAKFYRPGRWSDAQIAEEHAFTAEMAAEELPVVTPLVIDGRSLFSHAGFRFALFPRQGGRAPEFDRNETLEWMGRLMARIHMVGARQKFIVRETLDIASFGTRSRDWLLDHEAVPAELEAVWGGVAAQALEGVAEAFTRAGAVQQLRLHGDCHAGNVPVDRRRTPFCGLR